MSDDLVKRLHKHFINGKEWYGIEIDVLTEAANRIEADAKLIQEMREALQSAKEELYQISHSGGNPDDEANMDSYAAAYRECKQALSKAKSQQEGETE
jgi:hypothetical protein